MSGFAHLVAGIERLRSDCRILLANLDALEEATGEGPEGEDRVIVEQIRTSLAFAGEAAAPHQAEPDDDDYHRPDASGYSRADEEWFFDADGRP